MSPIPTFKEAQLEGLARVLGECGSGSDITRVLDDRGLADDSGESTKWRRLYRIFLSLQRSDGCANRIVDFISAFLTPARFVGRNAEFEQHRQELNAVLAFSGLQFGADGCFRRGASAQTLGEAEERARRLRTSCESRKLHPESLKYCRAELMADNYFHAVFEAAKGLAQRLRDLSGETTDGATLVDRVFSIERPILALNSLQNETEKSVHKGFAALLKGCFAAVRNPLAHEPKILWEGEEDAADYMTLISLLHRKLDACIRVQTEASRGR